MKLFSLIVILTSAVTFSNCVIESEYIEYASLDSLIKRTANTYIDDNDIKGISIGFVDVGNYRTEKGFGNVDSSTLFPMASVTKVITATAIMELALLFYAIRPALIKWWNNLPVVLFMKPLG